MKDDWFEHFFEGLALDLWDMAAPAEVTEAEADFLEAMLAPSAPARLLDLPCGNGRHAIVLAQRGHALTGLELSETLLERCRANSLPSAITAPHWVRQDMRCLSPETVSGNGVTQPFDGAYCMGHSFGYFNAEETQAFFDGVSALLRPAGRFVLDTDMAAETLLPLLEERSWSRVGELLVLVEHQYDLTKSRLDTAYTIIQGSRRETRQARHWIYTCGEIHRMLAKAGLEALAAYSSLEGETFEVGDPRLLLVLEKGG